MNKITWAIQTNLINDLQLNSVWYAASETGSEVVPIVIIPFSDEFDTPDLDEDSIIIPYGSTSLSKKAYKRGWKGLCYDDHTFRSSTWNQNHPKMLNSDSHFMNVSAIEKFFEGTDLEQKWFIRPVRDLKEFDGTVTTAKEMMKWMNSVYSGNYSFSEDTEVMISPVQDILAEYRYFIVNGKIIDGSMYKFKGRLMKEKLELAWPIHRRAQELADMWLPHPVCVMDCANVDDELKVIEYNTINSTGFYDNDIGLIVRSVTDYFKNLEL